MYYCRRGGNDNTREDVALTEEKEKTGKKEISAEFR
jgi:hypothetical protein